MGAWIEIDAFEAIDAQRAVAPHVGAWIEICRVVYSYFDVEVAPHVGAWIEIYVERMRDYHLGRTPRGCVD